MATTAGHVLACTSDGGREPESKSGRERGTCACVGRKTRTDARRCFSGRSSSDDSTPPLMLPLVRASVSAAAAPQQLLTREAASGYSCERRKQWKLKGTRRW